MEENENKFEIISDRNYKKTYKHYQQPLLFLYFFINYL